MDQLLTDLLETIKKTPRPVDESQVIAAWEFAAASHSGQVRLTGDPYITHPTQVAKTLATWNLDTVTIVSGLLHDVIEESPQSKDDLLRQFGPQVYEIVNGVSKITEIRLVGSKEVEFVENLRKMLLVMAKDLRVILIKFADRIHNLQTFSVLSPESQQANVRETLDVYAPLAERLGMGEIKSQLEDLCFPYAYPQDYAELKKTLKPILSASAGFLDKFHRSLSSLILPHIPGSEIHIRQKHLYSLFIKLRRPEISGDLLKIHDLFAARILVGTKPQCYQALGLIHEHFHPVPYLGMSDFIATPKPNGYQSIHTKVFGPEGRIVELQIRTFDMHDQAEMGVAAHWQYSQAKSAGASDSTLESGSVRTGSKLTWVRQLLNLQEEIKDNSEYMQALKIDILNHRLLVFSPKGDVYDLPVNATPVDFAYSVHTELGSQVAGAKVNAKLVPLDHKLRNGDVVELILNRKRKIPSSDWLDFVVTTAAHREIKKHLQTG